MSEYTFTAMDVVEQIRVLATQRPDFNYTEQEGRGEDEVGCSYVSASTTGLFGEGCIVGQALVRLGVPFEALPPVDDDTHAGGLLQDLGILDSDIDMSAEDAEIGRWIIGVQEQQDTGSTWGQAVSLTDYTHPIGGAL